MTLALSGGFGLPAYPAGFGLGSLHNCVSQFFKANLTFSVFTHILLALILWRILTNETYFKLTTGLSVSLLPSWFHFNSNWETFKFADFFQIISNKILCQL